MESRHGHDSGYVLGRVHDSQKVEGELSQMMRGLTMHSREIGLNITNIESGRTDFVSITSRSIPVKILREEYCETLRKDWDVADVWFEFTDIILSFNGVTLKDDGFTLAHYGIRPGSTLVAVYVPKVSIKIKNHTGTRKTYQFWGTWDMTIQMVKEKYEEVRYDIGRHDWTAEDIVLLDQNGLLVDDRDRLDGYVRFFYALSLKKRGRAYFCSNYRRNGSSFLFSTSAEKKYNDSTVTDTTQGEEWDYDE